MRELFAAGHLQKRRQNCCTTILQGASRFHDAKAARFCAVLYRSRDARSAVDNCAPCNSSREVQIREINLREERPWEYSRLRYHCLRHPGLGEISSGRIA